MKINPAFPPARVDLPTRRAERDVYQELGPAPCLDAPSTR